jgi:hypothetical protein
MALPLIAAGVVARAAAKKLATKAAKKTVKKSTEVKRLNPSGKTIKKIRQQSEANGIAKNSVKVKKPMDPKVSSKFQKLVNEKSTKEVLANKSGSNAKNAGKYQEKVNSEVNKIFGKDKPIKINSAIKSTKAAKKTAPKKK